MNDDLCSGKVTWRDLKEKIKVAGVDDDTLIECNFIDIRDSDNMMVLGLSTTREMSGIFASKVKDIRDDEIKRYIEKIKVLNAEIIELQKARIDDGYRISILSTQIDKLIKIIATAQDVALELAEEIVRQRIG